MGTRTPIVCSISWPATILQLTVVATAIVVGSILDPRNGVILGAGAYLAYFFGPRYLISRHHRRGVALSKRQHFEDAIPEFRKSLDFFDSHPWIDRFRYIVLLSTSAICYREMAMVSMAFCYAQIGDGVRAREHYEACLVRFPESGMAVAAIRLMDAAKSADRPPTAGG